MRLNRFTALACMAGALSVGSLAFAAADEGKKEEHIQPKDVPGKVMEAFKEDYPGVTITEVEKETYADGTIHFEFAFTGKDGKKHEVEYNADGEELDEHEGEGHADHKHDEKHDHKHDEKK